MGDRFRIGELLAAIGTIGLALSLGLLHWFQPAFDMNRKANSAALSTYPHNLKSLDAGVLGWFAFVILFLAIIAGIVFFLRALTAPDSERPMLQAPYAYVISGFAFLVLVWRLFLFQPGPSADAVSGRTLLSAQQILAAHVDVTLAAGAWVGFVSVTLMMLGFWFAMYDERTGGRGARRQTDALLADVAPRAVPHVPAPADPDAAVVADDAVATDPSSPSSPASGGPA
ncbi:MAG: hypothetical protein AAGC46_09465 [Solirubrobacteraceae bacterium]|nr:hypothetical protein [Patulibacter sp.]